MRFAVDTGGTFTDLVVEDGDGQLSVYKSPTVPADPVQGILDVFGVAAAERGVDLEGLLAGGTALIHGTTRGLNAVLTGSTAKTAFLTTEGHPDILLLREGGRTDIFDLRRPYPEPYVPRSLTFEIGERVLADGTVSHPLNETAVVALVPKMRARGVEAVAVCLLWSIVNPEHELRVGDLLAEHMPEVAVTLSHQLNPCLREYRRASATAIDASLKPIMTEYIGGLRERLGRAGFTGRVLIVTSAGGVLDADDIAETPIHSLNSGPAMAPVAGRFYAGSDAEAEMAIVADTGGTSYDVSVVRHGRIPWTRESWIGPAYFGHMTGFPAVDVRSVGAGGGSIAWVDQGGLLHVGPESAGADPGPACYGQGGLRPTTTDACLALGLLDPEYFLGGRTVLDLDASRQAIRRDVAEPLDLSEVEGAAAILRVATERMVSAIEEITVHEGIDPAQSVLVGGGGAAGFNSVAIANRLGCPEVIIPSLGPALSAAGALISDLSRSFEIALKASDVGFDFDSVNGVLAELESLAQAFIDGPGKAAVSSSMEFSVEARYPHQAWELEVPLRGSRLSNETELQGLREDFHSVHQSVFAIADPSSAIDFQSWHARVRCRLAVPAPPKAEVVDRGKREREVHLPSYGALRADVWRLDSVPVDEPLGGPAIIETPTTTVLVDPGAGFRRHSSGTLHIVPSVEKAGATSVGTQRQGAEG
jgi:N-methylhydantoinase A